MFNVKQNNNSALTDRIMTKRKCKRSSCRVYSSNLRRINKEFSKEKFTVSLNWLQKDAAIILSKIKRLSSVNKQRNFVSAALIGFDLLKDKKNQEIYNAFLKILNRKKAELQRTGIMTEKEKQKFVPWKQIIKLRRLLGREVNLSRLYQRENVTKKDFQKLQRYLVIMLMTELPPVRNEYADVKILSDKELKKESTGDNVLLTSRGGYKFIWLKYKTAATYGKIVIFVPKYSKTLQRLLVKHVKYLRKHFPDNKALLLNQNYGPLTRNALTKYLQRLFKTYFKKNVSTTAIRQSFLTNRYSKKALEEDTEIARAMGHSRNTQQADYVKAL
jgi:hypothetical protein